MTNNQEVCGEPTRAGQPCTKPPAWGRDQAENGPCKYHAENTVEKWKSRAYEVAEILEDELVSLQEATSRAEISVPKLHRMRKKHKEIGDRVDEAMASNLEARGTAMEDAVFRQVLEGEASGNLTKFMLKNYLDRFEDEKTFDVTKREEDPVDALREMYEGETGLKVKKEEE